MEELRALLNPTPGEALDHLLNNLTAWAVGLDTQDGLKVVTGSGWLALWWGRSDARSLTPWPQFHHRSGLTTRAGTPWLPL